MNILPRSPFIFICLTYFIIFACVKQPKQNFTEPSVALSAEYDTLQRNHVQTLVNQINEAVQLQGSPEKLPFPIFNSLDTLKYWRVNGVPARISAALAFPDKIVWPTYFIHEGEIILIRYRMWSIPAPSYAIETITYLQKGKVVYCNERKIDLKPEELPANLRGLDFTPCGEANTIIGNAPYEYWKTIKEFMNQNITTDTKE